jgi:hypothetical protein
MMKMMGEGVPSATGHGAITLRGNSEMTRWWKRMAIFAAAAWLGLTANTGQAQSEVPSPVGATRIIEPLRYCPQPQPQLIPNIITPAMAPLGPPDCLALPSTHSSAFQEEHYTVENRCYASIGGMALRREYIGHLPLIFQDDQTNGLKLGVPPVGPIPVVGDVSSATPTYLGGARLTIGYLCGDQAIEASGFFIPEGRKKVTFTDPGRLFLPFSGPNRSFPVGFEGDNGMWLNADQSTITYQNQLGSAELNYRTWNSAVSDWELILGFRYLNVQESIVSFTNDDASIVDLFHRNDPRREATYVAQTRNNLLTLQAGGEYSAPIPWKYLGFVWFTGLAKVGVGPNFIDRRQVLSRGDGLKAFDVSRTDVSVAGIAEVSAFVDFHILERLRLRVGYTLLGAVGIADPVKQVDFDITNPGQFTHQYGGALWHGPVAELQFLF